MKRVFIANAFSLSMLEDRGRATLTVRPVAPEEVRRAVEAGGAVSAVRHPATASLIDAVLGLPRGVWAAETTPALLLGEGDTLFVFLPRWKGGRPPETREYGVREIQDLADGVQIYEVTVRYSFGES